ncbi:MAG: hypothetical protein ABH828_00045 [archaeon]
MEKFSVVAKDESKIDEIREIAEKKGLKYVSKDPHFVISLGGDGTFLISENKFPGVPKLLIRDSKICKKCVGSSKETILDFIKLNAFEIKEELKLEGSFRDNEFIAINDIIIRNKVPNQAIRFDVSINAEKKLSEVIGDGIVVATPFGSSAYFKSITRQTFDEGLGIAFSNSVEYLEPMYVKKNQVIKVKLTRGDAEVAFDNERKVYIVKEGELIIIRKAAVGAKIITLEGFEE